ncbi:MAG: PEP-utilizing enzyme, partial [Kiritimatiellae bacterium]|nr:PEP-utilizing enzyme [Kiritimatiellia bacterium]
FETHGLVYCRNPFQSMTQPAPASGEDGDLHGTSCCGGQARGPVRVILTPGDDLTLNGEILVAEKTDPGWIPLYPSISGLLIERGSVLSHSAIVAREMGIPAIVGIPGLTTTLKDGDQVEMDASAGLIRIIPEETSIQ